MKNNKNIKENIGDVTNKVKKIYEEIETEKGLIGIKSLMF